jgi:hypothetical protein
MASRKDAKTLSIVDKNKSFLWALCGFARDKTLASGKNG